LLVAAVSLQCAGIVEGAQDVTRGGAALFETTDEGSHQAALKKAEGQILIAAVRVAFAQRALRRYETAARSAQTATVRHSAAWRYGATFARTYVPSRRRELFAPLSSDAPDA
jgi:hypothetical protein